MSAHSTTALDLAPVLSRGFFIAARYHSAGDQVTTGSAILPAGHELAGFLF
jgi:hypothetical protein